MTSQPVLHATGVYVSLGGMPVLRDVGISVCPGSLVALLGGNGSGKSTFVRALLGLSEHTEGTIEWFGTPLAKHRDWGRIGYVPQRAAAAVNATVAEVVTSGLLPKRKPFSPLGRAGHQRVREVIKRIGLTERMHWPMTKLSGGQQQRALIARALVGDPEVLVLDEPMAGVDLPTQASLAQLFRELKETGLALLVVMHEQGALADLIDETVVLHDGRVVPGASTALAHGHAELDTDHPMGLEDPVAEVS